MYTKPIAVILILVASSAWVSAHDTGHHADMTRTTLTDLKFGEDAIRATQVANWLTDYYSAPNSTVTKDEFEKLHFDDVFNTTDVRSYWNQFAINTQAAVVQAAKDRDTLKFIMLLGLSLHTVQDFYTHSNWPEKHPRSAGYRTATWWSSPVSSDTDIYTGWYPNAMYPDRPSYSKQDHGDYFYGLNKDSYVRPKWDEGYIFAFAASEEWAIALCAWAEAANPGFVDQVRAYQAGGNRSKLDYDVQASYRISEWVSLGVFDDKVDGHWKGNHSGRIASFLPFVTAWMASPDSPYVKAVKTDRYQLLLTRGLYTKNAPSGAVPTIAPVKLDKVAVSVRTLHLNYVGSGGFTFSPTYYALLDLKSTSGNQSFIEAMQKRGAKDFDTSWWTMHFVDRANLVPGKSPVAVRYGLYNEDSGGWPLPGSSDRHFNIKGSNDQDKDIRFNFDPITQECQGDINGVHDREANAAAVSGKTNFSASAKLLIRSDPLVAR